MSDRIPGFAGLLLLGHTPQQAWQIIRDDFAADPGAQALIAHLASTEDGRAALELSRQDWKRHGLTPPWENLPEGPRE
jgi:hypothetical protein